MAAGAQPWGLGRGECTQETGTGARTGFHGEEVGLVELFAGEGVCGVVVDVLEDETALVDMAGLCGHDGVLRGLARNATEKHVERVVVVAGAKPVFLLSPVCS